MIMLHKCMFVSIFIPYIVRTIVRLHSMVCNIQFAHGVIPKMFEDFDHPPISATLREHANPTNGIL